MQASDDGDVPSEWWLWQLTLEDSPPYSVVWPLEQPPQVELLFLQLSAVVLSSPMFDVVV